MIKAKNVLTYVDAFDKRAPAFRGHYDILSERCHPNSLGHNFMFSKLDRSTGSVSFLEEREPERNGHIVFAALAVLPLVESMMSRLDELILKVSDFHHSVAPVRRVAAGPVRFARGLIPSLCGCGRLVLNWSRTGWQSQPGNYRKATQWAKPSANGRKPLVLWTARISRSPSSRSHLNKPASCSTNRSSAISAL
jgi:hypothetical protein